MTGATHIVTAATIYKYGKYKTPVLFILAFFSHFLLDAVPHYELDMAWNYVLGACAMAFLLIAAKTQGNYKMALAGLLGGLPDAIWIFHLSPLLSGAHRLVHFKQAIPPPALLLLPEALFALTCAYLLQERYEHSIG